MSRGPRANQTLADAIAIAKIRGTVQMAEPGPEMQYDFTITGSKPSAFVSVKYTEHILMLLAEISRECDEKIRRLRLVAQDTAVSCELWLRSRYGTWRFFRVFAEGIVEIGRVGKVIGGGEDVK
jgi:hypothetical protein